MTAVSEARCALHFDAPAERTCGRCGRFTCASCVARDTFCTECAAKALDPYGLSRGFSFGGAASVAAKLVWADLPRLLVIAALFAVPGALLQLALVPSGDDLRTISESTRVSNLFELLIGTIGTQATLALFIARSEGRQLGVGGALREGAMNWARAVGVTIRSGLWTLFFLLLLVLPGLWMAVMLIYAPMAAIRVKGEDALEASRRVVRGRFWLNTGVALLSLTPVAALTMLLGVAQYVSDEVGAPRLVIELVGELSMAFATSVLMNAFLYVAFVMLHVTAAIPLAPMRWNREPPLRADG